MDTYIQSNDLVYIPHLSSCLFTARYHTDCKLYVEYGYEEVYFYSDGRLDRDDVAPLVYLATPEIKAKLENFYGITLEDIPVDKELKEFCEVIEKLLDADFDRIDNGFDYTEVDKYRNQLIQMFKERGSK